jgi:(p)ppGpp synthase/HD superfamily hydrolase
MTDRSEAERVAKGLETAIAFAAVMHRGQVDKGGEPYILHPLRIMGKMVTREQRIAAVLHDVVEDCDVSLEKIEQMFGPVIAAAVDALTRREGESYMEFIDRACTNEIALFVKLADVRDNLDLSRLGRKPTPADKRRTGKYIAAKSRILALRATEENTDAQ